MGAPYPASTYGVPKGGLPYEPAEKGLPSEHVWSTEAYVDFNKGTIADPGEASALGG